MSEERTGIDINEVSRIVQDPDLYVELAKPYPTEAEAKLATVAFLEGVLALRKEHRIPEVLIVCAAYTDEGSAPGQQNSVVNAQVRGSSAITPQLAAMAYNIYTVPAIQAARDLEQLATGNLGKSLRTEGGQ